MKRKSARVLPAGLETARQQFERWRARREGRSRIPERLWTVAVNSAQRFGVHRTSRSLRLDYAVLKRHVAADAAANPSQPTVPQNFVEVVTGGSALRAECVVEIEEPSGVRMRIEVKGLAPPDLVALTRSLRVGGA